MNTDTVSRGVWLYWREPPKMLDTYVLPSKGNTEGDTAEPLNLGPSILSFVELEVVLFQRLFCTELVYKGTFGLSFV